MRKWIIQVSYIFVFYIQFVFGCLFPDRFQGQTWFTNIRATTQTSVYFRSDVMEYEDLQTQLGYVTRQYENNCFSMIALNKYIVREDDKFRCVNFVKISKSVMQLKYSKYMSNSSADLCDDRQLELYPWLFVYYPNLHKEFTLCPISGGYNIKIRGPDGIDHPCNFIDLPMRMESECLRGEGITFYLRSKHCISSLPMSVTQRALCVAHWRRDGDAIVILRDPDNDNVWCLRVPARSSFSGKTKMYIFTDATCETGPDVTYYTLELELVVQNTLCTDEHQNCHLLPCSPHFESQCLQYCGKCNPNIYPTSCDFPKMYRGDWLIQDSYGTSAVNISTSRVSIDRLGTFSCTDFEDSPSRRFKQFTTLTFFSNGCRPRFTCIAFKTLNTNVLGISVSQSQVWPLSDDSVGAVLCDPGNFHGDPAPIRDTFRSFNDVFKPLISTSKILTPVACPLQTTYLFNATFSNGTMCSGSFYKMCQDNSVMRFEFYNCPLYTRVIDYSCLGTIDSKYWEQIIVMSNIKNNTDTRCLILSDVEPGRMIMLPSGECDKFSRTNADAGIRTPILSLLVTPEWNSCKQLTFTTSTTQHLPQPINDAWKTSHDVMTSDNHRNRSHMTHKHRHHKNIITTTHQTYFVITSEEKSKINVNQVSSCSGLRYYSLWNWVYLSILLYLFQSDVK